MITTLLISPDITICTKLRLSIIRNRCSGGIWRGVRGGDLTFKVDSSSRAPNGSGGWFNETPIIRDVWWDSYIDKYNLWFEFANLHRLPGIWFQCPSSLFKTLTSGSVEQTHSRCIASCEALYRGDSRCAEERWIQMWLVRRKTPQTLAVVRVPISFQ